MSFTVHSRTSTAAGDIVKLSSERMRPLLEPIHTVPNDDEMKCHLLLNHQFTDICYPRSNSTNFKYPLTIVLARMCAVDRAADSASRARKPEEFVLSIAYFKVGVADAVRLSRSA
jgi:hypothetical protein